jgi:hypothetical protein
MRETDFQEMDENQRTFKWIVGVTEAEAQYVFKQLNPSCGEDIYARDATPEETEKLSDPTYMATIGRVE